MIMNKRSYKNCCVFGCLNTTLNRKELSFFSLPVRLERRNEWLKLIQREDLIDKPATHCSVCEDHFDPESILISPHRKLLKQKSIPKLLLPNRKYESTGSQATVETTDSFAQCEIYKANVTLQTPKWLISGRLPRKKLKKELHDSKKRLKTTTTERETKNFYKLCDKFLSKKLADVVKEQTKLNFDCSGNK